MLAYHEDKSLKTKTVNAMKADIKAERLQPGHYWNGKNGCFVGCVIRGDQHSKFEDVLGIPRILARLGDNLYEALGTTEEKQKFAVDYLESIRVGSDLTKVWPKFAHAMLVDPELGVIKFAKTDRTKKSIQDVADLYLRKINGEDIDVNVWLEARKNADAYAAAACARATSPGTAAATGADADAAYAAAYAAAAAAAAAYAAAYAAAAAAAAACARATSPGTAAATGAAAAAAAAAYAAAADADAAAADADAAAAYAAAACARATSPGTAAATGADADAAAAAADADATAAYAAAAAAAADAAAADADAAAAYAAAYAAAAAAADAYAARRQHAAKLAALLIKLFQEAK